MARSFEELFICGPGYSLWTPGTWNPAGKLLPASDPVRRHDDVTPADWQGHHDGTGALIVSPTLPDKTCLFGVIDADPVRKADRSPQLAQQLFELLHSNEIPAAVCESKSNGAHAYLFWDQPEIAADVFRVLNHIVEKLDIKKRFNVNVDIRPAASATGGGTQIQLPYFGKTAVPGAFSPRAMWLDGRYITVEEFVQWCNQYAIVDYPTFKKNLSARFGSITGKYALINKTPEYEEKERDGPPCFAHFMLEEPGVDHSGHRDDLMYHLASRLPMMFEDDWKEMLHGYNMQTDKPLSSKDIDRIVRQVEKKPPGPLCERDFVKDVCDKTLCASRKFGVMARNTATQMIGIEIAKIVKFKPPEGEEQGKYPVHIYLEGREGYISTTQEALLSFRKLSEEVFHNYKFHVPHIKADAFYELINGLMAREGTRFFEIPMPREMTLQGRFERLAKDWINTHIYRGDVNAVKKDSFARGSVLWDRSEKLLIMDLGVFLDQLRVGLKEPSLQMSRVQDMFYEGQLMTPGVVPMRQRHRPSGCPTLLCWWSPRWAGDGHTYPEDQNHTLWFEPRDESFG